MFMIIYKKRYLSSIFIKKLYILFYIYIISPPICGIRFVYMGYKKNIADYSICVTINKIFNKIGIKMALTKFNLPANIQVSTTDNVDFGIFVGKVTIKPAIESIMYTIANAQDNNRQIHGKIKLPENGGKMHIEQIPLMENMKNDGQKQLISAELDAVVRGATELTNFTKAL